MENEAYLQRLGRPYSEAYKCLTFVRDVYGAVGLTLPPIVMNVRREQLENPPVGFVLYLRRKSKRSATSTRFTHAGIIIPERSLIHCSYYFGKKVVISDLDEVLEIYDLVEPNPTPT